MLSKDLIFERAICSEVDRYRTSPVQVKTCIETCIENAKFKYCEQPSNLNSKILTAKFWQQNLNTIFFEAKLNWQN